ncbi:MAG TPA: hypothetical protein VGG33_25175 [Polyangia bacterium]
MFAVTLGWTVAMPLLAARTAFVTRDPALLWFCLPFFGSTYLIATWFWPARRVYLDGEEIVVGSGAKRRRIPLVHITTIEKPWWARPDRLFIPAEITVRGGSPVRFFPASGAVALLRRLSNAKLRV